MSSEIQHTRQLLQVKGNTNYLEVGVCFDSQVARIC